MHHRTHHELKQHAQEKKQQEPQAIPSTSEQHHQHARHRSHRPNASKANTNFYVLKRLVCLLYMMPSHPQQIDNMDEKQEGFTKKMIKAFATKARRLNNAHIERQKMQTIKKYIVRVNS
jgi:hypothetical protein